MLTPGAAMCLTREVEQKLTVSGLAMVPDDLHSHAGRWIGYTLAMTSHAAMTLLSSLLIGLVLPRRRSRTWSISATAISGCYGMHRLGDGGLDAVTDSGERLPFALHDLLHRLESPLLQACGSDDVLPMELHIQAPGYRLPVRTLTSLK